MIDDELIEKKVDLILTNLTYLEEVKQVDEEEFLTSFEKIQATKHSLQEAIEGCLDIANHILASKGWKRAETYAAMFERLCEHEVIGRDLKERLGNMARFRNLLVHRYGSIDDEKVLHLVSARLEDIYQFIEEIERFLEQER